MNIELTDIKKIWFKKIRDSKKRFDKNRVILDYTQNRVVLDVGCVGQDIDYTNSKWIHNQVKDISKELIGVDINRDGIKKLNQEGYNIFHFNDLNESQKFDTILMLDVIEHINDPIKFIEEYKRFLKEDGKIIITTPNSNRGINFINIFFKNDYALNYEHTFWFCPKTFMEVIDRVDGINIKDFFWLNHYILPQNMNWKNRLIYFLDKILINLRSHFSPNFMFILELKV